MNSEMQRRLYEIEVTPPQAVWDKLSVIIDEINEDDLIAKKVLNTELIPPAGVWEKINSTINIVEEKKPERKAILVNLRRLAAAAIVIGIIAAAWIVYQNNNQATTALTSTEDNLVKPGPSNDSGSTVNKPNESKLIDSPVELGLPSAQQTIASTSILKEISNKLGRARKNKNVIQSSPVQYASLNKPLNKSFDQPIDDLSGVTSDQNYFTMVNANGRLVKIPAHLVSIASYLQDKPISEDIYEVMFGEGAYWKETLHEWRKKVASASIPSGDAFASFIELLKSVQDK